MGQLVSFGIPELGTPESAEATRAFGRLLERRLNGPVQVTVATSYSELLDLLSEGRVDFAWLPPLEAAQASRTLGVDVLLRAVRAGRASYGSAVFVRADSPLQTVADLAGKRVALVHRRSASGFLVPVARLAELGVAIAEPMLFLRSHGAVVRAVAAGEADAGATFATVTTSDGGLQVTDAAWLRLPAEPPCEMRPLAAFGPIPSDAICAWPGTPRALRDALAGALRDAAADDEGRRLLDALFGTSRFGPPEDDGQDLLHDALRTLANARRRRG